MSEVNLELMAMRWLRWEKRCVIVITERSPRALWCGEPDVLGMTKDRYLYEIEVKRSLSDFRADAKKPSRAWSRNTRPEMFPKQFYYLVPNEMAFKVNGELPDWAGLMRGPGSEDIQCVHVVKSAPNWKPTKRLTPKEAAYLVMKMSNQILSLAEANEALHCRTFEDKGWDSWQRNYIPDYNNFQI